MSPQDNSWDANFATFMVEHRLKPQFERASSKFSSKWGTSNEDASAFESMRTTIFDRAKEVLAPVADAKPSLLHGGEACYCLGGRGGGWPCTVMWLREAGRVICCRQQGVFNIFVMPQHGLSW